MVKPKKQSKRLSTRQRTKIERKVREHHKKVRKETKRKNLSGFHISNKSKDPGIPKNIPNREEFIAKAKADYEQENNRKLQQKSESQKYQEMQENASSKTREFETKENIRSSTKKETMINDNSKRAFMKDFHQVVEASDVILEVLDARDPIGSRVTQLEKLVLNTAGSKKIILILNKVDLVPKEVRESWLAALRKELPCIGFKSSTQSQRDNLGQVDSNNAIGKTSGCVGAQALLQLLKNYCRNADIKTSITVGVVGYPNVGKSSLINSLKRSRVCKVGATPGVTTSPQYVNLDKSIKLIDSPGIVFTNDSTNSLILQNCIKVEQIEDPVGAVAGIFKQMGPAWLAKHLGLENEQVDSVESLLRLVAVKRGKLLKGGLCDISAAALVVLNEWNSGKIPFYREVPLIEGSTASSTFSVVSSWSPVFDLDQVYNFIEDENTDAMEK
jgi:nuclear GTP-binding protein